MAQVAMTDAVPGQVALAAEYNKLIDNIQDLDTRLGGVTTPTAHSRLTTLETNQGTRGSWDTVYNEIASADARLDTLESAVGIGLTGGEYRASGTQSFGGVGLNKLTFATAISAASGITYVTNNQFTITAAGLYAMSAFVEVTVNANNHFLFGIGKSGMSGAGASGDLWTGWHTASGNQENVTVSAVRKLAVSDTLSVFCYINTAGPLPSGTLASRHATFSVWRVG